MNFLEAWDLGGSYGMELLHKQGAWLTPLLRFVTSFGNLGVIWLIALLSSMFFIFIGKWRTAVCLMATILLCKGIEQTVKPWVHRARPELRWVEPRDRSKTPSFPSGHALMAMGLYGCLAL